MPGSHSAVGPAIPPGEGRREAIQGGMKGHVLAATIVVNTAQSCPVIRQLNSKIAVLTTVEYLIR